MTVVGVVCYGEQHPSILPFLFDSFLKGNQVIVAAKKNFMVVEHVKIDQEQIYQCIATTQAT